LGVLIMDMVYWYFKVQ